MFDGPEPSRRFNPIVPGLIGLAFASVWISLFPVMANLCVLASDLIARIAP